MHRKFQKKRVIFRSWEACTISRPFFRSFLCKTAPRRPHLKNKSKPVRDRLAHAPLKTARRRPRIPPDLHDFSRGAQLVGQADRGRLAAAGRPGGTGATCGPKCSFLPGGQAAAQRGRILRGGDRMGKALPVGGQGAGVVEIQVVEQPRPRSGCCASAPTGPPDTRPHRTQRHCAHSRTRRGGAGWTSYAAPETKTAAPPHRHGTPSRPSGSWVSPAFS